ncbi:MAG TPA: TRAP transporter small permease subunit [Burkholderiales bacterium]|nr:TRAP transporter small permease subunit [Burkholderiales bacterium]
MPDTTGVAAAGGARRRIERLVQFVGVCTAWLALVIVLLMATNVLLRYGFSIGTVWAQELEWHLLAPLILFGMSYALQHGDHVRVDILYARFSPRAKLLIDLVSALLTIAISVFVIWLSISYVQQSYVIDEGSPDPGGLPHRFLLKSLIPIGFALLLLQAVASAVLSVEKLRGDRA